MNPAPLPKPVNSLASHEALRAGQIPTTHALLDFEQVESLADAVERGLNELETRFAQYVTTVSLKNTSGR